MPNGPSFIPSSRGPCPTINSVVMHADDFVATRRSGTADASIYELRSQAGSSTFTGKDDGSNGVGIFVLSSSASDNSAISLNGEPFQTAATSRVIEFIARIKVEDADQDKFWIGLHENGTLTTGNVIGETTFDGIGFYTAHATGGTPTIKFVTGNGTSQNAQSVTTGSTLVMEDDTWVELAFRCYGRTKVDFWVNGTLVGSSSTYIPTNAMTLIFQAWALDTGADDVQIDYWHCIQDRS